MSTRIIHATDGDFQTLNVVLGVLRFFCVCGFIAAVLGVLRFFCVCGFIAAVLCVIATILLAGGTPGPAQSAALSVVGSGIFTGLGVALYCLTVEQALILGKRAVTALEQIANKTLSLSSAAGSVSPRPVPLPPPP